MEIVVRVRKNTGKIRKENHKVILNIDSRTIPNDLPLTKAAISHYKLTKISFSAGFVDFKTLRKNDILSIISASRRGETILVPDRFRRVVAYKILN
jgi:hypothetical protein